MTKGRSLQLVAYVCWFSIVKLGSYEPVLICVKSYKLRVEVRLYGHWDIPLFASD